MKTELVNKIANEEIYHSNFFKTFVLHIKRWIKSYYYFFAQQFFNCNSSLLLVNFLIKLLLELFL